MKKNKFNLISIIIFLLILILMLLIPSMINITFSFIIQIIFYIINFSFFIYMFNKREQTMKKLFYNYSYFSILIASNLIALVFLALTKFIVISPIITTIIDIIILIIEITLCFSASTAESIILNNETKRKEKITNYKQWKTSVEIIDNKFKTKDTNKLLLKIFGSDPVSIEKTEKIDTQISNMIDSLKEPNEEQINKIIEKIEERNIILKNNK